MTIWLTEIQAIDPETGELCKWSGPRVEGITARDAQQRCQEIGQGYCRVVGSLITEVPVLKDGSICDVNGEPDYENISQN